MKITPMKNHLDEDIWHATYDCPGCGHLQEVTLYSVASAEALRNRVEEGIHLCGTCLTVRSGGGVVRPQEGDRRFERGSYSEKMRTPGHRRERTET